MANHPPRSQTHGQLEELYSSFLASRPSAGEAEFEAYCGRHPEHADGLRELHAQHAKWRTIFDLLATLAPSGGAAVGGANSDLLTRLRSDAPRHVRYTIEEEVGRGGMGAVLRVRDEELRRTLAMKVRLDTKKELKSAAESESLGRFFEEAQITGQLDHPGIVPVHELGLGADGQAYFTMRLVKGEDLRRVFEHVEAGRDGWTTTRVLGVLLKVCEAMAYAHDKGVVHRDIKPANIMVGRYGEVYVMDWGLARTTGASGQRAQPPLQASDASRSVRTARRDERDESPGSPIVTMDGDVIGTPAYMPPEQARGELDTVGPRSDVYAVGAMLYHLLALGNVSMPYVPKGARLPPHAVLGMVLAGPPPSLSQTAPAAPAELAAICEKAMARDPAKRHASMLELAEDLRAYLEGRIDSQRASLFELAHLPPSLVFLYVGAFVAVLGSWVASTVAWSAFSDLGRAAFLTTNAGLLGWAARRFWSQGDYRRSLAASLGLMLVVPVLAFALLHLLPAFSEVRIGDQVEDLSWSSFDAWGAQVQADPGDADQQLRAQQQQRIDLKLLLVALSALGAGIWMQRATNTALHWWMCVLYAWCAWWLLAVNLGWRALKEHHRLEALWVPAVACIAAGFFAERAGRSARARPLLVVGFLVLAASWVAYAQTRRPLYYVCDLAKIEQVQLSMAVGGVVALLLGWSAQRLGTPLLQRYAAAPYLVSSAAVLLSLSVLVADRRVLYEFVLPAACFAFVLLAIVLQRKNLLYAGSFYLAVAVFQISHNHFELEWAWPMALVAMGVVLGTSSFLLRRFDGAFSGAN